MVGAMAEVLLARGKDQDLVDLAKAGDRRALGKLLSRYELVAWRVCKALAPQGEDLDSAVQEVLLRAVGNIASFRGDGDFAAWLGQIAANYCRDLWRKHRLGPTISLTGSDEDEEQSLSASLPALDPDPERVVRVREGWERLLVRLRELPARQREVFGLRFFAQLEIKQIAVALGVDVGTVKTHLHRAVRTLRKEVQEAWP